uniref:ATP synthase complex subunit 8 n=1 Tax=Grandidierella rubroantennata TaxID=2614733 RepID=A0A5H2Y6D8_9CRUS|nr:ATP synthase F0 subunit 8 [Grandidierella rubroantennata]
MPQMAPTMWLTLLLFIMMMIFLFMSSIYTISLLKSSNFSKKKLMKSFNWKL